MAVRDRRNGHSPLAAEVPPSPFPSQHSLPYGCSTTGLATVGVGLLSLLLLGAWCLVVWRAGAALPVSTLSRARLEHAWPSPPAAPQLSAAAARYLDVAEICSPEFRRRNAQLVDNGTLGPAVLQWGCPGLEACGAGPVQSLSDSYRQRQMADVLHFVPCDLFKEILGRTLWIVGDSQQLYFYRQLRCFLGPLLEKGSSPGEHSPGEGSPGEESPGEHSPGEDSPGEHSPGEGSPLTTDPLQVKLIEDTMLRGYCCGVAVPNCTHLVGGTRLCHVRVNFAGHFVEDYLPNLHLLNVSREDIMVLNFGLWHQKQCDCYKCLVQRLADYIRASHKQLPTMIWRDTSPQHFAIENGEYPHPSEAIALLGSGPKECVPIGDVLLTHDGALWGTNEYAQRGGWRNTISNPIMRAAGVHILSTWNETITTTWNMHFSGECSHFCAPGGYSI